MNEKNDEAYLEKTNLEYVKMAHAEWLEGFKGVRETSIEAIKAMYLLNGGALIALLALLGNMYGKTPAETSSPFFVFLAAILPAVDFH